MKLVIPMCGNSQRFFDAGYLLPKPLLDIQGFPMFFQVTRNIKVATSLTYIVRRDHDEQFGLKKTILTWQPGAKVIVLPGPTEGAACTVLEAIKDTDQELLIANSDQLMVWDPIDFYNKRTQYAGGTVLTFTPQTEEPKHSYAQLDENGHVIRIAEKEKISNIATVGVYYFRSEKQFKTAAEAMISADDRTNNEFYLAPAYNYIDEPIGTYHIDKMLGMGTPAELDELKASEWWDKIGKF